MGLVLITAVIYGQEKKASGKVINRYSKKPIEGVKVSVIDTSIYEYTDSLGRYTIQIPKGYNKLSISYKGFESKNIYLKPGYQHKKIVSGMVWDDDKESKIKKLNKSMDSALLTLNNSLTLSCIELLNATIGLRYNHFISHRNSIGVHSSFIIYGRNPLALGSESDYYYTYYGIKIAPAYRYYVLRKVPALFVEAKIPVGYFYFSKIEYHPPNQSNGFDKSGSYFSFGASLSIGTTFRLPMSEHGIVMLTLGYQYFPVNIPEEENAVLNDGMEVTYPTDTNWWYEIGPGSRLEVKLLIGFAY